MFVTSVFDINKRLTDKYQILLIGRSNVGKSSFINSIFNRKSLAKVSKTPGKTLGLNYYLFNDKYLVDAPGYGYARRDFKTRDNLELLITSYLNNNCADLVFQLIDFKVGFTQDDLTILNYLITTNQSTVIIFTKVDKVKHKDYQKTLNKNLNTIGKLPYFLTSSFNKKNIDKVIQFINDIN